MNTVEEGNISLDVIGADNAFANREICTQIYEVHPNGQTKDLRIIFDDTTMVWRFDSTGANESTETHVNNKLLSAKFFYEDGTIEEEQKYLWNDTIDDLNWTIFYFEDSVTIEGLSGNDKYWGQWYIKYPNDTVEVMYYGYPGANNNIPDTMKVYYHDSLVGFRIKNIHGNHDFHELKN